VVVALWLRCVATAVVSVLHRLLAHKVMDKETVRSCLAQYSAGALKDSCLNNPRAGEFWGSLRASLADGFRVVSGEGKPQKAPVEQPTDVMKTTAAPSKAVYMVCPRLLTKCTCWRTF